MKMFFLWLFYRWSTLDEMTRYKAAQAKGYYCEGIRNGVVKFDTSRPPQEKPNQISYKDFKNKMSK